MKIISKIYLVLRFNHIALMSYNLKLCLSAILEIRPNSLQLVLLVRPSLQLFPLSVWTLATAGHISDPVAPYFRWLVPGEP